MANPNPVRQRRGDSMSDRMKAKFSAYVPRQRLPGEALPITRSMMNPKNIYKPTVWAVPVR